jgi:hypothetical protein
MRAGENISKYGAGGGGVHREVLRSAERERGRACERMREGCGREHVQREERLEQWCGQNSASVR